MSHLLNSNVGTRYDPVRGTSGTMTHGCSAAAFHFQADLMRSSGSAFVAGLLDAAARQLDQAPRTAALIRAWPGDPRAAALPMRFNGAINALVRDGRAPELGCLDIDDALAVVLAKEDDFIAAWMRDPPQTNEVGRAAPIMAALMVAARIYGMPFDLLELGSSAGLNLNLEHYAFDLGGRTAGDPASALLLQPRWTGAPPPDVAVEIRSAIGVDLRPLSMADADARDRLRSFAWTDDPARAGRLEQAIGIALVHPPRVDQGSIVDWLPEQLRRTAKLGHCRAIIHSMALQYLLPEQREAIAEEIGAAAARADLDSPLIQIGLEWTPDRLAVHLVLTDWTKHEQVCLAICHPYAQSINWQ